MESKEKLIFTMKSGPIVELTLQKLFVIKEILPVASLWKKKKNEEILHDTGETERAL